MNLDKACALPFDQMRGEDDEETQLFNMASGDALAYVKSHAWCKSVIESYFCFGVGGIVEVFLFRVVRLDSGNKTVDEWLWVVVGDIPFAYLVTDEAKVPREALSRYCDVMQEWINMVLLKGDLSEVYPVAVEPTIENATQLAKRIEFLRAEIVPIVPVRV